MIVANKNDTVVEIVDKIKNIYKLLPFFLKPGVVNWNQKEIVLDNGCRIKSQARSKEPAIGFTIDLLYMDEFAHLPPNIINHFYRAAVPTVSSIKGSKIVITSTPNGGNLFKDLVMGATLPEGHPDKNPYKLIKILWHQVPDGKYKLDDGTEIDGTRLDPKLQFKRRALREYGFTMNQLFDMFKESGFVCRRIREEDEKGVNEFIKILYERGKSSIDIIRQIEINGIPISKFFLISNWQEDEIKLIGSEENFNQEYNLQFIAGSKLVLDANKSKELDTRAVKFVEVDVPEIKSLRFDVHSVRFDPDFDMRDLHKHYWVTTTDMAEGLGQDFSVINGFRLMVRDDEWLRNNEIQSLYDAFYLKQTFVIMDNELGNRTLFPELYYKVHFEMLRPERLKAVLEMNGPADGLMGALPGVFNSKNMFGKYIFAKYLRHPDDKKKKIGYKVTSNKKDLVKQYIDAIESDVVYVKDQGTIEEMGNFIKVELPSGAITYRADSGHDDLTMSVVGASNYVLTQDFKNLVSMYYSEIPYNTRKLIDAALGSDYNKTSAIKPMSTMSNLRNVLKR